MAHLPDIDPSLTWFVALPDNAASAAAVAALRQRIPVRHVDHASGRPWLVGRWRPDEITVALMGDRRLAVLGEHRLTPGDLARLAGAATDTAGLCAALRGQPGSFHVVAADPGSLQVHGTLSGFRRVFFGAAGSATVTGDRADVVAALLGADVDEDRLTVRLLSPSPPWPYLWQPVWRGVEALAPADRLIATTSGGVRTVRRWDPPPAELSRSAAGDRLRDALAAAVEVRSRPGASIATDLSGLDSTSLCALAAGGGSPVVGLTCVSTDPLDDDLRWARRAVTLLPRVTHEVITPDQKPPVYDGVLDPADRFDEPTQVVMHRAGFVALSRRAAGHDARIRLTGFGGDELLSAEPLLQLSMLRSDPGTAIRHLRILRASLRWRRRDVLRAMLDRSGYSSWLSAAGRQLDSTARFSATSPVFGWGVQPHVAPWITGRATARLRELLIAGSGAAVALGPDGGTHFRLLAVHAAAAMVRQLDQMTRRVTGVPTAVPYLDDQVLEAALAVRLAEVTEPGQYKPLLVEAMRGVVPPELLARRTKAETSIAEAADAAGHRADLLALAEDSRLARLGLIDPAGLRRAITEPGERTWFDLDQTLACETWLRALRSAPEPVGGIPV